MDVARFAESHGYEQDYDRKHAYHYRDFLIKAFNRDMPFAQLAAWQLAGDELVPSDPMALAATGFLGAGAFPTQLTEAEFESARYNELDDIVSTIGTAFLGLSVGCARCHDHKYDPIPSDDYYRLASTFTTTIRSEIDVPLGPGQKPVKMQVTSEGLPHTKHNADERGFPHFYPKTYILRRGDVSQKAGEASPDVLRVLNRGARQMSRLEGRRPCRLDTHQLSPRGTHAVAHRHQRRRRPADCACGRQPFVAAPFRPRDRRDSQRLRGSGSTPLHPALLEWLAAELVSNGWQLKALHRLIVTSAVYQQSDQFQSTHDAIDPDNAYYWRYTPWRARSRANPRQLIGHCRAARRADVRAGLAGSGYGTSRRLFLYQAQPARADHDALRLARTSGEYWPAEPNDDRSSGPGIHEQSAGPALRDRPGRASRPTAGRRRDPTSVQTGFGPPADP